MMNIIAKQQDLLGTDKYRDDSNASVPMAYRPTTEHTVSSNPRGTSNMSTVRTVVPVVITVDGVTSSQNQFPMTTKFASLQAITNDVEREKAFDSHMAFLTAAKTDILAGRLPVQAYILA